MPYAVLVVPCGVLYAVLCFVQYAMPHVVPYCVLYAILDAVKGYNLHHLYDILDVFAEGFV